jgi:HAMP domain-containing protein
MNPEFPKPTIVSQKGETRSRPSKGRTGLVLALLRNKLVLAFFFFALIVIVADIKLVSDVGREMSARSAVSDNRISVRDARVLGDVKDKALVLLGITIMSFGAIISLYIMRVAVPLNTLSETAREISRGNLSVTAPTNRKDDVGELGGIVNDLAANFQEVLLLTGTIAGNFRYSLEKIESVLEPGKNSPGGCHVQEQLKAIKEDLELLSSIVEAFEFYHTHFDGRKVVPFSSSRET